MKFKITKSICQIDFSVGCSEVNSVSYYSALSHEIERFMPKKNIKTLEDTFKNNNKEKEVK